MSLSKFIYVKFTREGIHCFPAAATDTKFATGDEYDVSFLSHPHRHIFHFKVSIEVFDNDREIEFIQFKRWLSNLYSKEILELNNKSCEMIAEDLLSIIRDKYPHRSISIDVSEDNENGAVVQFDRS